ncbi:MAG: ATP phosphoribosyltransferase [Gammaproteobacteria bacterium]|nr:ATP phosphoribosyltransferase [Gammaproteobacteria bacterium]RPG27632.1 MAG: ATP phosphoribosyltransferase [Gammaproteobacteria bacterium TMED50]|tara:strand:+ start:3780 stop:4409 length:630 start_codon:yes stop_codon:yes gene_type:complete
MLALTKGDRVLDQELALLARAGIEPLEDPRSSRKLIFDTSLEGVQFMLLRSSDVATYVQHGIADVGMAGRDVLLEHGEDGYYQPLDLDFGHCRIMEAGLVDEPPLPRRIRVATKFVNVAQRYYARMGRQVDIIKLYGAMELAPMTGMAHRIIDIVETGNTLKANGLTPMNLIHDVSTRLIVNKTAMKVKHRVVAEFIERMRASVKEGKS